MTRNDQTENELKESSFILAMTMLVGFLLLIGVNSSNLESVKIFAGVFGGWIGTIIGYYFGQRPVKRLTDRVEDLTRTQTTTIQQFKDAEDKLIETKDEYRKLKARFRKAYDALSDLYETSEKEKTK